uniref:ATP synthase F0 subunit 8 n=1 Tax=Trigonopterus sp. 2 AH-2016 TaxID=1903836 RepID=A0A343C3Y8_9CUCU|nr:ATP synthase F0 subunit 8 [Trigonopterus sp. 2 AH-2016]
MPQMAPINWTLMYMFIIFLYLSLMILNFYLFKYKISKPFKIFSRTTNTWK